ncbi:AfsR/SARP family transcriptional regulator [Micromonosporaceae bacterium Da 78-11]
MDHDDITVRVLGPVRIRRDGQDQPLGSGRRAAVLAVLALTGAASREQIVAAVWGDEPPASATGNVYTHVTALRDLLGAEVLTRADGVYRLRVTGPAVDARRFEALRARAGRHRAAGDPTAELTDLRAALSLWDGAALAGVSGPFAEAERARLHELRLAGEQRHAEVLLDLGRHDAAIEALRPLVAAHPLQESLHRLLMIALDVAGRPEEALDVYAEVSASLSEATGIEPATGLRRTRGHIAAAPGPWSPRTRDVLRAVAFLGEGATPDEVCQVTGLPRADVEQEIEAARADGLLSTASGTVVVRDPALARTLHGDLPRTLRTTLHGFFAEMIADAYGPPERVAAQLLLTDPEPLSPKAGAWLLEHVEELALRSPADAITLLRRAHLHHLSDQETHLALSVWLARLLFGQGRDAVPEAGWAAARTADSEVQAEMLWIAACGHDRNGRHVLAADIARSTLSARRYAQSWLDGFRGLLLRLRLHLPGEPTEPRHGRASVVDEREMSAYRQGIAADRSR